VRIAHELFAAFQQQLQRAKAEYLQPAPTFRHLINAADAWVRAHGKASAFKSIAFTPVSGELPLTEEEITQFSDEFDAVLENFSRQIHECQLDGQLELASSELLRQLNTEKLQFLAKPSRNTFDEFKRVCISKINQIKKIAHCKHSIYTTVVLREFFMLLRGLVNLISFMVLKPIYIVSMSNKKVFEPGLYKTFFCPPKTNISEETHNLSQGIIQIIVK